MPQTRKPALSVEKLVCPFENCTAGVKGKPLVRRVKDISWFRGHLSTHKAEGFIPSSNWLAEHVSVVCPCCSKAIVSLSSHCFTCTKTRKLHASSAVAQSAVVGGVVSDVSVDSDPESDHDGEYEVEKL